MSLIHVSYPRQWNFNEADYVAALVSLERAQEDLDTLARHFIRQVPSDGTLRYFPHTYNLNAFGLAHILRRHYMPGKHPGTSKFIVSIPEIVKLIRVGMKYPTMPARRPYTFKRVFPVGRIIGIDLNGNPTSLMEVVTDCYGWIRSAYPAMCDAQTSVQTLYKDYVY
jgi:hypothetical protein